MTSDRILNRRWTHGMRWPAGGGVLLVFGVALLFSSLSHGGAQAPVQCGDLDASGEIAATDALLLLKKAVGLDVVIACPECPGNTTTTTTSSTLWSTPTTTICLDACTENADCEEPQVCDNCGCGLCCQF